MHQTFVLVRDISDARPREFRRYLAMPSPRRFPPPWSVKEQPVLFLWLWRNTEESFVYLLPERIDGISP